LVTFFFMVSSSTVKTQHHRFPICPDNVFELTLSLVRSLSLSLYH
jgi:hypothetical protein